MITAKSVVIADITFVIMKIREVLVIAILIITISVMFNVWNIGVGIGARRRQRMSVTIKNLDMPIGCQKCKFFRKHIFGNGLDYSYSCILGAKEFPMPWIRQLDNRAVDCPIIEADKETENDVQ